MTLQDLLCILQIEFVSHALTGKFGWTDFDFFSIRGSMCYKGISGWGRMMKTRILHREQPHSVFYSTFTWILLFRICHIGFNTCVRLQSFFVLFSIRSTAVTFSRNLQKAIFSSMTAMPKVYALANGTIGHGKEIRKMLQKPHKNEKIHLIMAVSECGLGTGCIESEKNLVDGLDADVESLTNAGSC